MSFNVTHLRDSQIIVHHLREWKPDQSCVLKTYYKTWVQGLRSGRVLIYKIFFEMLFNAFYCSFGLLILERKKFLLYQEEPDTKFNDRSKACALFNLTNSWI